MIELRVMPEVIKHVFGENANAIQEFKATLHKLIAWRGKLDVRVKIRVVWRALEQVRDPVQQIVVRALL